jgi:DNA-directed RNA polymerase specialized sigma24 family protein
MSVAELDAGYVGNAESQWGQLVDQHCGYAWSLARSLGLADADAAEVCELAWLRLAQRWSPSSGIAVRPWLEETIRREARGAHLRAAAAAPVVRLDRRR